MKSCGRVLVCASLLGFGLGCGGEVAPAPKASEAAFKGTNDDDKAKVAEILKKEGIDGEIVGLIRGETMWQVDLMKKTEPGKRAMPAPPTSYTIDKATGKVKREM